MLMSGETLSTGDEVEETTEQTISTETAEPEKKEEVVEETKSEETSETEEPKAEETEEPTGAPEKYEDFVLPEGWAVDEQRTAEFGELARELDLTQDKAQKLVDSYVKGIESLKAEQEKGWADTQKSWRDATKSDEQIGGARLKETQQNVGHAISKFGNDAFRELLDITGVGDNVEMVRFLAQVGQAVREDSVSKGGEVNTGPIDPAKVMFPNMN